MATNLIDELRARGLAQEVSSEEELGTLLAAGPVPLYAGYDPTASSLHVGNLVPTILLARFQAAGHKPLVLVGGATGMIGDPSGRSDERNLLDQDTLAANLAGIRAQLERFLDFSPGPTGAVVVNNADWFRPITFISFLRDVGKYMTVNYMAAKESVRTRLEEREQGISYTEFSYMLLQAYDFVHLAQAHGCRLQVGGSDQWGNITAGIELQRKMGRPQVFGLVAPLLLDSSGEKMGKSSSGQRIWLDPERTSPYAFYQYWLNLEDADVKRLLHFFSRRSLADIAEVVREHDAAPARRLGQRALAEDLTTWVHGADALRRAVAASQVMFGGSLADLTDADLAPLLADVPASTCGRDELAGGVELVDLLARTGLAQSKGAARRLLEGGGVYVNNLRVDDPARRLTTADLGTETMLVLRSGKKSYHIVRVG